MSNPPTSGPSSIVTGSGLRALAHPVRLQMLSLMTGAPFSASELSRELGVSQALASYHLRQLHQAGFVELAEERIRRGGRERRYAYRIDRESCAPSPGDQSASLLAEAIAEQLRRRIREAEPGQRSVGIDAELWVDPDDWETAQSAIRSAAIALHEHARPPRTSGSIRVSISAFLFKMSPTQSSAGNE